MAVRHSQLVSVLVIMILCAALTSCVKNMGSGLLLPENGDGSGQWEVLDAGFQMGRTETGRIVHKWRIAARFETEPGGSGLEAADISAAIDGVPVPFTFEKESQIFKSMTTDALTPGNHRFELFPSENPTRLFATFTAYFEAP